MVAWKLPPDVSRWIAGLAGMLHGRTCRRLKPLCQGVLFARGRRTVTSWLRAADLTHDYQNYYYFVGALGRKTELLAVSLLRLLLGVVGVGERLLFVLDDSPTQRYGPHVQGAGIHHHPTPGPTDQRFLYGHVWVTLALVLRHAWWDTIALPVLAKLYVRQKDIGKIPKHYAWTFQTKLALAAGLVEWLIPWVRRLDKAVWIVVDGFYAKKPFVVKAMAAGAVVVGKLRKDAALWSVPAPRRRGRGRPRKYGPQKLDLAKRAAHKKGWQTVMVKQYGQQATKQVKTFLATWRPAGGVIRVVIVKEPHGWLAFFCTDAQASLPSILEAVADRMAIEQVFHDVKEVEGAGQQQVRNIWANIAAFHMNLWAYTLVEMWAWHQPKSAICDRRQAPYDDADRRPSHADRRKALQRSCLRNEFSLSVHRHAVSPKIHQLFQAIVKLAA